MNFREMTKEQLTEESLINLAYAILEEKKASVPFNELLTLIKELTGYSDGEIKSRLLQFYTDINIDGRFLYNQETGWGLREWYKVEQIEEETAPSVKTTKRKSKAIVEDDEDEIELEEDDIDFDEDFEEFIEEDDLEDEKEEIDFEDEEIEDIDEELEDDFVEEEFDVEEEEEE